MINKLITLTEKGLSAGPDYSVFYSTDCVNYTLAAANVSLPTIGSTTTVSVADNTICIKLVNLSPTCNDNEVIIDERNTTTTTTTTTLPPLPTTTTTSGPTTTTTTRALPTTTTYGPQVKVIAHQCQDYYDFNRYYVPATPAPAINAVYKDSYGQCYTISSIPANQNEGGTPVGTLTYVGVSGSCSSTSCVTTTTTQAPFCNKWQVSNATGAGYYFKYQYCGQTAYTYLEVPANQSVIVCTQNDRIYNSFGSPLTFTNLSESCIGTTTTTTQAPPLERVVAHSCQDFYDFGTYGVNKNLHPSSSIGEVFKDAYGTCYYITSIPNDQTLPVVGILSFVGGTGACSSSQCVTTTTTVAPYCNTWLVENPYGFGQYFKYKYCGQTSFSYPEVAPNSEVTVCVQNDEIFNSFSSSLVYTNLSTVCNGTTTTTTTAGPKTIFTAAPCQDIYDFHVYQAASASYALGDVFTDSYGTCYQILSFNGQVPVGELTFVGSAGSCSSPSCITTTTTASPFCTIWKVENPSGAGYTFKYKYCGQTDFSYLEVPQYGTVEVCVQNNEIYDAFNTPLIFDNLDTSCIGTTTTTTTFGPKTIFTAAPCQNISDFHVFQADSASYNVGDVFIDDVSTCYTLLSFNGEVPVGNLTYLAPSGSNACNLPPCLTTTTTAAPFCNQWQVTNAAGASYSFKYKYCGQTEFTYPTIAPNSTMLVCVQNNEIYNSFGAPITFDNLEINCIGTTTTTTSTTTTTLAPGCFTYDVYNYGLGTAEFRYVYCGASVTSSIDLPSQGQTSVCVDNNKIETSYQGITWNRTTGSCAATTTTTSTTSTTTTTTTTLAPGCYIYDVTNAGGGTAQFRYVACSGSVTSSVSLAAGQSASVCVDNAKISSTYFYMVIERTNTLCTPTTTTTSTTTTAGPTTTSTTSTTTTTIGTQKIRITDCDAEELDILIYVAVNGPMLSVNDVITFTEEFIGITCWKVTSASASGTPLYARTLANRFEDCATCTASGGTTTTAAPTTTTAAPSSTYWRAEWCCDPLQSSIIRNDTGLSFLNMVVWNPEINQCMRALETVATQSISYTYNNSNYLTYAFGNSAEQCENCISSSLSDGCPEYGIFAECCDTGSTYVVYSTFPEIFTGSYVIYNPVADTCMQFVSSTTASTPDLSITSSTYFATVTPYGNLPWSETNCIADHNCPGVDYECRGTASVYTQYSSGESNTNVQYLQCNSDGTYSTINVSYGEGLAIYGCVKSGSIKVSSNVADYLTDFEISYTGSNCTTTTTSTTTTTTYAPSPITASGGITGSFESGSITYKYHKFTGSANFVVHSGYTEDAQLLIIGGGGPGGTGNSTNTFAGGGAAGGLIHLRNTILYPSTSSVTVGNGGAWIGGSASNGSLSRFSGSGLFVTANGGGAGGSGNSVGNNGGSGGGGSKNAAGGTGIVGQGNNGANGTSTYAGGGGGAATAGGSFGSILDGGDGLQYNMDGTPTYYAAGGGAATYTNGVGIGGLGNASPYGVGSDVRGGNGASGSLYGSGGGGASYNYLGAGYGGTGGRGIVYVLYPIAGVTTTTTTTSGPTTTTTSTTSTTTTSTTTTTTAGPGLVSGYKVFFDIGNVASYPGSGSTVTNLGSGGSAMNGTLSGGSFSSSNGGVLDLTHASRDKITFTTAVSASFTTFAIVKHNGSSTAWGANSSYYNGFPNIRGDNGIIVTNDVGNGTLVLPIIWNGSSAQVPSSNFIYPANIAIFHSYAYTSNGTNEHKMYLDTGSAATATNSYSRGNSANLTSYINYDAPNNGSEDLIFMAYLQYDRVLTASEIEQNYTYFASRL